MRKRILITGAGAPGGPGIIKALANNEAFDIHTCDANEYASGRFLGFPFFQVPPADDPNFIASILEYSFQNKIGIVLPLVTKELFKFSESKDIFSSHKIGVIVSDYSSLHIANDKGKLYQHLQAKRIALPEFHIANSLEELIKAIQNLNYPQVPVCIKPTVSNGSRGIRILQENISEYDLLFNHKPNHIFTTLTKICNVLKGRQFPPLLVSEYLPGLEFTVDTIVDNGVPKLILPRSREQINSGISIRGRFERNEAVIAYCNEILCSLKLHGPIGLQVKQNTAGEFRLLEINPRLQGTSVAALGIGINLPVLAVQQEFEDVAIDTGQIKWGTSFIRYYQELFY